MLSASPQASSAILRMADEQPDQGGRPRPSPDGHPRPLLERGQGHRRQRREAAGDPLPRGLHPRHRRRIGGRHGRPRRLHRRPQGPRHEEGAPECPEGQGGGAQQRAHPGARALPQGLGRRRGDRRRGRRRPPRPAGDHGGQDRLHRSQRGRRPGRRPDQQQAPLAPGAHAGHGVRRLHRGLPARSAPHGKRRNGRERPIRQARRPGRPGRQTLVGLADRGLRPGHPAQRHRMGQRVLVDRQRPPAGRDADGPPPAPAVALVPGQPAGPQAPADGHTRTPRALPGRHSLPDPGPLPDPRLLAPDDLLRDIARHVGHVGDPGGPAAVGMADPGLPPGLRPGHGLRVYILARREGERLRAGQGPAVLPPLRPLRAPGLHLGRIVLGRRSWAKTARENEEPEAVPALQAEGLQLATVVASPGAPS